MNFNDMKDFTGMYSISKTLRNELIPIGKTLENIQKEGILTEDEARAKAYQEVKKLSDDYQREYIENALASIELEWEDITQAIINYRKTPSDENQKKLIALQKEKRKHISKVLTDNETYKKMTKKEMYNELLPEYVTERKDLSEEYKQEKLANIKMFDKFSTYFVNFNDNRKNLYSADEKSGTIAYRVVHQNLPFFIDNLNAFKIICDKLPEVFSIVEKENEEYLDGWTINQIFSTNFFGYVISQKGITFYNELIGSVNKCVNLYCQQHDDVAGYAKTTKMKPLYKQILSISTGRFKIPDRINSDEEARQITLDYTKVIQDGCVVERIKSLLDSAEKLELDRVYIKVSETTNISKAVYGEWNIIDEAIKSFVQNTDKEGKKKRVKKSQVESQYSFLQLQKIIDSYYEELGINQEKKLTEYFRYVSEKAESILDGHTKIMNISFENLKENSEHSAKVKEELDKYLDVLHSLKPFQVSNELDKAAEFYAEFDFIFAELSMIVKIYDMLRNYSTMKPYSNEKYKLNFKNPTLAAGWDKNKEYDNTALIFIKDDKYYLGIMNAKDKPKFETTNNMQGCYKKVVYKLLPGPNKMLPKVFFSEKGISNFNPPKEILDGYAKEMHKKGPTFDKEFCIKLINWYKEAINRHEDWRDFNFQFSDTESYQDISGFYREVEQQGYKITYEYIQESYIDELVEQGKLFLFQIYNKDFAPGKTGNDNLHTIYLKALFDEDNLRDVVFKLNGEAELFYRKKSIENPYVHKENSILINKWTNEEKARPVPSEVYKELEEYYNHDKSTVSEIAKKYLPLVDIKKATHSIVKNKRYTENKFMLHMPVTINFKAGGINNINNFVCKYLKHKDGIRYIGIDRGERNLLYVTLTDENGTILKQKNFNIVGNYDYREKLAVKELERNKARRNWSTIGKIAELKEGYLSLVINEIVNMMIDNDAVIVMEDLNFGFKRGRFKVEKQVYQKFENMLINKLSYVVRKSANKNEPGGVLKGLQLACQVKTLKDVGKQCGFIFYIPAAFTSKIDPATGFVNVFDYRKITSSEKIREFFSKFESIKYDSRSNIFSFTFNYDKFDHYQTLYKKVWTAYSNGTRIKTYKDKKTENYLSEEVVLTDRIKEIMEGIPYHNGDDIKVYVEEMEIDKIKELFSAFKLMLQLRNSISGTDVDYILSPIKDSSGEYYDSRNYVTADGTGRLPESADANGAYHIALKGKCLVDMIRALANDNGEVDRKKLTLSNEAWLKYMQCRE